MAKTVKKLWNVITTALVAVVVILALLLVGGLMLQSLNLVVQMPGLKTLNAIGGGALGLVWGALLVFLIVWAMLRFGWVLTEEMVENSYLLHFFATNSPLSLLALLT